MDKKSLRSHLKQQRMSLSPEEVDKRSLELSMLVASELHLEGRHISIFLSIKSNNEVNTQAVMEMLQERNKIYVPLTDVETHTIHHSAFNPQDPTRLGPYRIPEPLHVKPVDNSQIDTVFTPMLGCDGQGHRIGYGAGYYDRYFMDNPRALRIGLSLFPPLEVDIPAEPHDIPLDLCVSPDGVHRFPGCRI